MQDYELLIANFKKYEQEQVFQFWDTLSVEQKESLLDQAKEIDLQEVASLVKEHLQLGDYSNVDLDKLNPAPYIALPENGGDEVEWAKAKALGEEVLKAGRVAAFVVAGGQGTRLGFDGPKGTYPATPIKEKSLFAVFAEKIKASSLRYGKSIPWYVLTSQLNHEATLKSFEENDYFGLDKSDVYLFSQGRMPAVDADGKIILSAPAEIAMSPDGHGGSLRALVRSAAIDDMKKRGIDVISYFQVDNPLIPMIDPAFIGFHVMAESDLSSKMIPKAYPLEKVGMFCEQEGKAVVIEYSDLPNEFQEEVDDAGKLRFIAGSVAIHLFSRSFVQRIASGDANFSLPFHKAHKKIPYVLDSGKTETPSEPNGFKFEMFVFDSLPFANKPVIIEGARCDTFSPIKNAEGVDSPESSKKDQIRQWCRWANAAGLNLELDESGLSPFSWEVSPLFADSEEAFVEKWKALECKPVIGEGSYLV